MKKNDGLPEILAPAGSIEAVYAAVCGGADAVYFGSSNFNARRSAKNFSDQEMLRAIAFCKSRGVKVYVTLNTLVSDRELPKALELGEKAALFGADALIVTDLGLISLLSKCLPEGVELHASTQMSVLNLDGAKAAKRLGCSRVVLGRELSKENIRTLTEKSPVETEVFVHGALCYSVSGQCLMSSVIGRRSGNRGACAQPCRLEYRMDGRSGYLISLKDLCLAKKVDELSALGVSSLKIEGRMKRPEYAGAVSAVYKKALHSGAGDADVKKLASIFSRGGFTEGGYSGKRGAGVLGIKDKDGNDVAGILNEIRQSYENEMKRDEDSFRQSVPEIRSDSAAYAVKTVKALQIVREKPLRLYGYFEKLSQAQACPEVDIAFLPIDECIILKTDCKNIGVRLPFVIFDSEYEEIETKLKTIKMAGVKYAEVNNIGQIALALRYALLPIGGIGLNLYNSLSLYVCGAIGLHEGTFSPECSFPQLRDMRPSIPTGIFAYGKLPLMHTSQCVAKNNLGCTGECRLPSQLVDRTGAKFLITKDLNCRNTIYNSVPLWLADKEDEISKLPISFLSLYFTDEKPEACRKIVGAYQGRGVNTPPKFFTRGLYTRGVL